MMKGLHQEQIIEIQRINEQAKIHRRLLENLVKKEPAVRSYRPMDTEEILRQEKLRQLRHMTRNNQRYLSELPRTRSTYRQ